MRRRICPSRSSLWTWRSPTSIRPFPCAAEQEKLFRALYKLNAAYADVMLGAMLDALKRSGQWEKRSSWSPPTTARAFGEAGQIAHGGNLGHVLVEVPLVVKLPAGFQRKLAVPPGRRVANLRVGPTLICEAAGGTPEPGTAPSLFQAYEKGALSELYLGDGVNRFSLVDGDLQLLWESRFAPSEPDYYRARFEGLGGKRSHRSPSPPTFSPASRRSSRASSL